MCAVVYMRVAMCGYVFVCLCVVCVFVCFMFSINGLCGGCVCDVQMCLCMCGVCARFIY